MAGRVFKRGETWSYVVDVDKGLDGRRKQRKKGGFVTRREAQRALRDLLNSVDEGTYADTNALTLAAFLRERWLPVMQPPRLAASTWASYRYELERRVIPRLGAVRLQELTAAHLDALYGELRREGGVTGAPLSHRSVRYVHSMVRKALADAVTWGLVGRNVADRSSPPTQLAARRDQAEMRTWSAEELRAFLQHVCHDRLYVGWLLGATTGMRRGEVLGLRWDDVDLDRGVLSVRQTVVMAGPQVQLSRPKTHGSRRTIDTDPETVTALRSWRATQAAERLLWGEAWEDRGLVITRENGSWVRPDNWTTAFDRHVRASRLPRIRLHDLRHTHATLLLKAGVPPKVVSERLGHASAAFTMDTYQHVVPGMQAEAAARFAGLVFGQ